MLSGHPKLERFEMESEKLPVRIKLAYGVCDLGGNLFFTVVAFLLLNYLTDTVGISAGLAGLIIMLGKVWDAVTDPLVGYYSDRTKTKWGRRRPFMLVGSVPLFLTMILMFTNPKLDSQQALFAWGLVSFCLLCFSYTLVNIPYNSLTPELSKDYHERSSINGYRFGFAVIGTLLGGGAALPYIGLFGDKSAGFSMMGTTFGFIMMVTALITVFGVKEKNLPGTIINKGVLSTYLKVFRNKPYVIILMVYALQITAITIVAGIVIYYFKYIHKNEPVTAQAMTIFLLTAMAFIPVSVIMAKKLGKKISYGFGMVVLSVAVMVLYFLGHSGGILFSLVTMFFAGIGMGFLYAMPYAIVPDAVEYDYLLTGERTEGAFYGIWTFAIKIGQALALGITGAVLSLAGYLPEVDQTADSLLGIRLLLGPIPAFFFIAATIVLYFYPINEERYKEILRQISEME